MFISKLNVEVSGGKEYCAVAKRSDNHRFTVPNFQVPQKALTSETWKSDTTP
jgi:hypothetical protein